MFVGTRVPFQALIDYIEGGHTLEKFLDDFPSVPRELAIAALVLLLARVTSLDGVWRKIESLGITERDVGNAVRWARKRR